MFKFLGVKVFAISVKYRYQKNSAKVVNISRFYTFLKY